MSNTAHRLKLRSLHQLWQRNQSGRYVLRSQLGFERTTPACPVVCRGCRYYHGQSYGQNKTQRNPLICGIHPRGWQADPPCPDWQGETPH